MLLWGLAAGVPIVIHLLSKRKYQVVPWAAVEYLLAAVRNNARRIRIEQLILLLIRTAILVLLAVALADPVWSLLPTLGSSLGTAERSHFVLVLDGSYSMDYRAAEASRFEVAKRLAVQLVQDSRQGDGFTLVLMADPPLVAISEPAFDPADVADEIENLRLRHGGANLPMTLAAVQKILANARERHARLTDPKVCFFTDLGRTTWDDVASASCRDRLGRLAKDAMLVLFDVGQPDAQNAAITSVGVDEALVTVGREVTLQATVQNFGNRDQACRISLLADDQQVSTERITVAASGRTSVSLLHRFETAGEHTIEARLEGDALEVDNHRWRSIPVRPSIRVLCIEGRPGAARYVAWALEPVRSERPRVRVDVRFEDALLEADLERYDCVVLCNVGRFSRDEAAVLFEYVKNGGGLIIALGDQVQAESYNRELGGEESGTRVLPARLEQPAVGESYFFDPLEYRHPIVAPFARHERSGLLTTPVWKYFKVKPYDRDAARVALAFHNGDPAIVEERIARGRSILLATAVSPESVDRSSRPPMPWTALASWPSFPPLVHEMLALAARGAADQRNRLVGESLAGSVPGAASVPSLTIEAPDGQRDRVPFETDGEYRSWRYDRTIWSGIYTAEFGPRRDDRQLFAVNVATRESDLERLDPELLPSQFRRDFRLDQAATSAAVAKPTQYFRWFLAAVFVLLLAETYLAWHFGTASS